MRGLVYLHVPDKSATRKAAFPVLQILKLHRARPRDKTDLKDTADSNSQFSNTISIYICALISMSQVCDNNTNPSVSLSME